MTINYANQYYTCITGANVIDDDEVLDMSRIPERTILLFSILIMAFTLLLLVSMKIQNEIDRLNKCNGEEV